MVLDMAADGLGDRVAIGSLGDGLSFDALRRAASRVPGRLAASGASTVALIDHTGPIVPVALFGAAWAGASYAPLNYRLPENALTQLVERVQPAAVVDEARTKEWLTDATGDATTTFPEAPERPAILLFTSGTSAAPKAAVLHHENLLSYIFNTVEFASADEDEAVLLAVPPFHVAGVAAVLSSTYAGRRVVPLPNFSAEAWLRTARDERVTHAFVVPTMLARIVSVMESDPDARVPTLRHLAYGGARMPAPVLERALRLLPDTGFVNAYGLTETSSTIAVLGPDDHRGAFGDDPRVRARLESVGRPVPGIEVAIVDPDGNALPAGERGEILVRGAQVGGGYVDQPSQLDDEGWLHTGDLGWIDDDGYLFVGGRADDVIIRGGENISPAEIEDALLRHPDVTGAAAVGLPDEEWGERVGAMVTLRVDADGDVDAIVGWARGTLGSLKAPQVLVVCEELPTTATGKVLRRQVRDELAR
jgi:acyl-CoA synthetase (AMP-forming)/AMP-acid ligase II